VARVVRLPPDGGAARDAVYRGGQSVGLSAHHDVLPRFQGPLWNTTNRISEKGIKETVDFRRMTLEKGLI